MSKLDTNTSLPASWSFISLKELGDWSGGGTPSKAKPQYWQGGTIPWVSPKDMKTERISDSEDHITKDAVSHSTTSLINASSVLVVTRSGILRHTLPVAVNSVPVTVNQDLKALTPRTGIMAEYVAWALRAFARDILNTCSKQGTTVNSVETSKLLSFEIPVAPTEQQRSIVAEIEKQFSRLDEAVANLKRVKANLKRYKASVLKAAVEGKLTEEWRLSARAASRKRAQASELETIPKAGNDKWFIYIIECDDGSYYVGHTADLHDRWQRHCEGSGADWTRQHPPKYLVHFEECGSIEAAVKRENDLKTGFGRTWRKHEIDGGRMKPLVHNPANETAQPVHGEDMQTGSKLLDRILTERRKKWKGRGKYQEPVESNTDSLPILPEGWTWAPLEAISDAIGGFAFESKKFTSTGYQVLKMANIRMGRIDLGQKPSFIQDVEDNVIAKYGLLEGDLVVTLTGTRKKQDYGYVAIVRNAKRLLLNQRIARLRPADGVVPGYLALAMQDIGYRNRFFTYETGNVGQGNVGMGAITKVPVKLPPFLEQQQIVAEVERRLSVIDELETTVDANLTRATWFRQSILQRSFSGDLI